MDRKLPSGERRATILKAAGPLFGARGHDGVRLDEIAAAAGVTKPILYRHFADKTGLYLALLERHREDLDSFAAAVPATGTTEERVRAVLTVWVAYVAEHAYAWRMLFRDTGGGPEIAAFRAEVHGRARAVLVAMIRTLAEREIPERELEPLAELMSMGMANLVLWAMDRPEVSEAALVDAMARVWTGLLGDEGRGGAQDPRA
jgi:AcrR family transcriptional regulator